MKKILLVASDLGAFTAYLVDPRQRHRIPRLQKIENFENRDAHHKRANTLTVMEGRGNRRGVVAQQSVGTGSDGEQHNMELEKRRRLLTELAATLERLLRRSDVEQCFVAAPSERLKEFLKHLTPSSRAKVQRTIPRDLTKVGKASLLEHFMPFEEAPPAGVAVRSRTRLFSKRVRARNTDKTKRLSKKRRINKTLDRRFALRNQRAALDETDQDQKSLAPADPAAAEE